LPRIAQNATEKPLSAPAAVPAQYGGSSRPRRAAPAAARPSSPRQNPAKACPAAT